MQSMNLNGMQVIVMSQPALQNEQLTSRSMKPRLVKQLIGLGVVHIINGVFCIILQSISLEKALNSDSRLPSRDHEVVGHGFWTGIPFLVTGIIGIAAGIRNGNCQVVAFNILSIISAMLAAILITLAMFSAFRFDIDRKYSSGASTTSHDEMLIIVVMASMLAAVGILEVIICIWSAIVCCLIGVCNCCLLYPPQTQPLILSAEQEAALMCNPMFLPNQQQSTAGFYRQQQTAQYDILKAYDPPYADNNFMSAGTGEGFYSGMNAGMRRDTSTGNTTSVYEEIHDYLEMERDSEF